MKKTLYMLFLIPISIISMLSVIYLFSKKEPLFFLQDVKITGIKQLEEKEIMDRASPFLQESLLNIDIAKMKDAITAHPFVKEVRIKRAYPFSIVIDVKEKRPSALWVNAGGEPWVLDEAGVPYRRLTRENTKELYIINARDRSAAQNLFREVANWADEGIIRKDGISEINYQEGNVTIFRQKDAIEIILGKEEQKARLKRALSILEDAKKRGLFIKCIDARFEKGAIIQERKG